MTRDIQRAGLWRCLIDNEHRIAGLSVLQFPTLPIFDSDPVLEAPLTLFSRREILTSTAKRLATTCVRQSRRLQPKHST